MKTVWTPNVPTTLDEIYRRVFLDALQWSVQVCLLAIDRRDKNRFYWVLKLFSEFDRKISSIVPARVEAVLLYDSRVYDSSSGVVVDDDDFQGVTPPCILDIEVVKRNLPYVSFMAFPQCL
jgi:hypothetical protein